jgi:predicted O-methyltransferase YrrM
MVKKRNISHWNFKYIKNRIKLFITELKYPEYPWIVHEANLFLMSYLKKNHICLEWGSGRSTRWIANRCAHITSIEHNDDWYLKTKESLKSFENCLILKKSIKIEDEYTNVIELFEDNSLDICLVDGVERSMCALAVIDKIKSNGIILVDDIDRYIPTSFNTPNQRKNYADSHWKNFHKIKVLNWKELIYTDGVTCTGIWIKP